MKFSVSSSELLKQLQVASGAIGSNPVLPILEDFLFKIENKKLTIAATDLESSISTSIEVLADNDFTVAVPAKILLETLKALPQQPVTFTIDEENFGIEITSSYGKYRLAGENGEDFPKLPSRKPWTPLRSTAATCRRRSIKRSSPLPMTNSAPA